MGYQPKSYRKFLATSVSAVVLASVAAPFAASAATNNFPDVSGDELVQAVNYLVGTGAVNGEEDGNFHPNDGLTREQASKVLSIVKGLDTTNVADPGFTDVKKGSFYYGYIAALKAAGVIDGETTTTFAPKDTLTREQMAKILVEAYGLKAADATIPADAQASWASNYIKTLYAYGITTGDTTTTYNPKGTVTRGQFALFAYRVHNYLAAPAVTSVSAINSKQLVVQFNKAVDETDAKDLSHYSITGVTLAGSTVDVSKDGKTVTFTLATGNVISADNAVVTIDPIETKADTKVTTAKYASLFTYSDKVAPSVASIDAEGTEAVVTFAEPLNSEGTVSLDGSVISSTVSASPYYVVSGNTLTIKNLTAGQSYKLDVVGATDAVNNMSGQISSNFTVAKITPDNSKPTVATSVSGNKLTLSFSEEVTPGTVSFNGISVGAAYVKASTDNKTYTVDVQDAGIFSGTTFFTKEVEVSGFADKASTPNVMDSVKFNATFTADTTAPKFVSAAVKTLGKDVAGSPTTDLLLLTFDDAVNPGDFSGSNELVVKSIDGIYQSSNAVDLSTATFGYDLDGNKKVEGNEANIVAIPYNTAEKSSYSFELAGKVVEDVYGNAVQSTIPFSVVAPEYVATSASDAKDVAISTATPKADNVNIDLVFNKSMSDSAINTSNYTLGGKLLPYGTTLKFVDNRTKVEITLPNGSVTANGTYALVATSLTDVDGNTLANGKSVKDLNLKENVVPTASKVTVLDSKTFTVDFSEAVTASTIPSGITVKIGGVDVTSATSATVSNGKLIVSTAKDFALTDSISVSFKSTNLVDANGNAVQDGIVTK